MTKVIFVSTNGEMENNVNFASVHDAYFECLEIGFSTSFICHNVIIMKNAHGDRVIIQEVK